ncbi:hypothetical protein AB0O69_12850 [Streptomyces xiamenensis]|uniref:hypothetical protein n=1 Tax=Streptomyces xiamenensis TaxID=408015 RepID=UPI003424A4A6
MPATYDSVAFSELVRGGNVAVLRDVLPDALPWSTFLPERDLDSFIGELVSTPQGAAALDHLNPLALLLSQWRHSAEIYADPALHAAITQEPEGDLGPAPAPEATE